MEVFIHFPENGTINDKKIAHHLKSIVICLRNTVHLPILTERWDLSADRSPIMKTWVFTDKTYPQWDETIFPELYDYTQLCYYISYEPKNKYDIFNYDLCISATAVVRSSKIGRTVPKIVGEMTIWVSITRELESVIHHKEFLELVSGIAKTEGGTYELIR